MAIGPDISEEPTPRAGKSASAFRTISEVAEELDIPQHVLRFWETKFPQIKPLKRAGGRRYYRPADVELLRKVSRLLYREGYTIKGVQRLLKERGAKEILAAAPLALAFDFIEAEIPEADDGERIPLEDDADDDDSIETVAEAETPKPVTKRLDRASRLVLEDLLEELQALRSLLKPTA